MRKKKVSTPKRKVPAVSKVPTESKKDTSEIVQIERPKVVNRFSFWHLLTVALIFAGIGSYLIFHSFALIPVEPSAGPTAPKYLTTNTVSSSDIDLTWGASTSTVGIAGYNIYEIGGPGDSADGDSVPMPDELVGQTSDPSTTNFKITGLESYTTYGFYVKARDTQGNLSAQSDQVTETTLDDSSTDGMLAAATRKNASSSTWPYKSPFGDSSCILHTGDTTPTSGCLCQPKSGVTCNGSCVVLSDGTTGSCRPEGTYKHVCFDSRGDPFYCRRSVVISSVQDQGVDYFAAVGGHSAYVYAMGNGVITNIKTGMTPAVLGNGSFGPNWIAYQLKYNGPNGTADGLKIYVAEYCTLSNNAVKNVLTNKTLGRRWRTGDSVNANSILCTMQPKSIETGWAAENAASYPARSLACYSGLGHVPTQFGFSFSQFVYKSGGPKGMPKGFANGRLYLYTYTTASGRKLHYHPCSDFYSTKDYKGNWY